MQKTIPFYSNTPDNTHCFQAAMRMILKYFLPDREFTWKELEEMSAKIENMATWPSQMMINLKKMGFDVVMVEGFDGHAFINEGGDYLKRDFGEKVAGWQIANSDIAQEQRLYKELFDAGVKCETRLPELSEIKEYLDKGYLVKCTVNSKKLDGKDGYTGHFVVVYDMDDKTITFNNPGLPAIEAQKVSHKDFEAAWAYPNEQAKNFIALKY